MAGASTARRRGGNHQQPTGVPSPRSNPTKQRANRIEPRRLLGAFYTPDDLATVLTRWALRDGPGTILDPSFGGCAFLRAAVNVLGEQRARHPRDLVFGVDVDPNCRQFAQGLVSDGNFLTGDFLSLQPTALRGAPFKAVAGNPPYVRHHWLKGDRRQAARAAAASTGVRLQETASTWAYFVVHSLSFLAPEGRLALLLPEAILQADYARVLRALLQQRFSTTRLIHIRDRIFGGTDEPVVAVAAEGHGPGVLQIEAIDSAKSLEECLAGTSSPTKKTSAVISNGRVLANDVLDLVESISRLDKVRPLGDLAKVRIGFVTGSNHYFIKSRKDIRALGVDCKALVRIVARTRWLTGLEFTEKDHELLTSANRRTLLIRPTDSFLEDKGVKAWLAEGLVAGIHKHHKCSVREPWFRVHAGQGPDAFTTCSRLGSPLLVLNSAGYPCTNALHAVKWTGTLPISEKGLAVSFLSSLPSLWAEIHGRRYGGGVLKLEPGTLCRIPVPLVEAEDDFSRIDKLLRSGDEAQARNIADEVVLRKGLGLSSSDLKRLERARADLARQRIPSRLPGDLDA